MEQEHHDKMTITHATGENTHTHAHAHAHAHTHIRFIFIHIFKSLMILEQKEAKVNLYKDDHWRTFFVKIRWDVPQSPRIVGW